MPKSSPHAGTRSHSSTSEYEDVRPDPRQDSVRSSRLGSFIEDEPNFDSMQGSSDTDSEVLPVGPTRLPVSVVWQNLVLETGGGLLQGQRVRALNSVSGYAEPRTVLAVVGPAKSGKSALVNILASRVRRSAKVTGNLMYNGKGMSETGVRPTFFCASDEPLANVTVEQALIYTALLQMPDKGSGELEAEVRQVCQQLGLLNDLTRPTNGLDLGTKRRLMVACQMICCTSLLIMHDTMLGIQEGDALAILRAIHDLTKEGCTAVVVCQQPTTDICSFFTSAYILVGGEVVYFGDTGTQAVNLLMSAGMPCPPLYSPVEQYMRLVDPSFEVYLQAQGGSTGQADDWNARFSSMMFKVLQGTYQASPLATEAAQRAIALASASYEPVDDGKMGVSSLRQWFILCRRLVTQGLQGLPLYLGRIIFTIVIVLTYGGSYWKLNYSFLGGQERTTILFLVAAVLPALAVATLPFYHNGTQVFLREHRRCKLGVATHFAALFTLTLPHLAAAAVFAAIVLIPMCALNDTGAAWGYFIVNATMAQMCADSMMLAIATVVPPFLQNSVGLGLLLIQGLSCGFFPGQNRGFNLPMSVVSFISWSYKGLLRNEFAYSSSRLWTCPGKPSSPVLPPGDCTLNGQEIWAELANSQLLQTKSRWDAIYILVGIYGFWSLLYTAALFARTLTGKLRLGTAVGPYAQVAEPHPQQQQQPPTTGNPIINSGYNREPLNGHSEDPEPPV